MSISASPHRGPAPSPASMSGGASASASSSSSSNNLNGSNNSSNNNGFPRVEFQAVILATSFGSALFPLTREGGGASGAANVEGDMATAAPGGPSASPSNNSSGSGSGNSHESIGRAHLPVANRPLLHYQLDMIHKAGFPAVIVVTRDSMRKSMARMVDEWKQARGGAAAAQSAAAAAAAAAATATAAATPSSAASGSVDLSSTPTAAQLSSLSSSSSTPLLDIDLVCLDTYRGTADALRQISEKIHTDFFCLSGDLISNVQFQNMADLHRSQDAGLIMCVQNSLQAMGGGGSGTGTTGGGAAATAAAAAAEKERRSKEKEDAAAVDTQYFGIDEKSGRLLLFKSAADVEESLSIDKRLLQRHPNFTLHTHFKDCHLYVFSQWVLFFLRAKPSILSIQSELIPCLVSGQYKAKYAEWRNYGKSSSQIAALRMSHAARKENEGVLYGSAASPAQQTANMQQPQLNRDFSSLDINATNGGSSNSLKMSGSMADLSDVNRLGGGLGGRNSQQQPQESFRIFVYQASGNTFCQRANTLSAYKALNHELAQDREYAYMPWPAVSTDNQALAVQRQMGSAAGGVAVNNFSVLGENVQFLGDGVTIKRSCVARNCTIGAKVKMQGCVVMEGVSIEEGCSLTDCVIGSYAVIGKNSVLKDCKIGPNFKVETATECKNEILCDDD